MGDKIRICEEGEEDEIKIFSNSYFDGLMYNLSNNLNLIQVTWKQNLRIKEFS